MFKSRAVEVGRNALFPNEIVPDPNELLVPREILDRMLVGGDELLGCGVVVVLRGVEVEEAGQVLVRPVALPTHGREGILRDQGRSEEVNVRPEWAEDGCKDGR